MKNIFMLLALISCAVPSIAQNPASGSWGDGEVMFELIGQVKNSPGSPPTSVQYGYLPYIHGLTSEQTFAPGSVQNETTAFFTFYNDSTTVRTVVHGRWTIVTREGTSTVYFHDAPHGDLTTPNPDSFRDGTPVMTSSWRHQVIFEPTPSGLFFVTFSNTITSSTPVTVGGQTVRLGKPGDEFRIQLVGGPDPAGLVNGKFAGNAIAVGSKDRIQGAAADLGIRIP